MLKLIVIIELLFIATLGYSQGQRKIKGEIRDEDRKPIPGLVVIQLGTKTGTVTDVDGKFELTVSNDPMIYVRAGAIDLEIYLEYSQKEEFKKVTLKDWKKIKKENKRILNEWNRKLKKIDKN
ncbi:MAG TPA: carboxypeptidase-like regulatory domain-containing protein [Chryseolinea sp.]|nr:carboxypeptidase-like regulatory domain-containing protein [Chryseolinea sp.]HPM29369.1 carboxypeptidase-like regulatory domain-containing protein [Chryseolinea sp.]